MVLLRPHSLPAYRSAAGWRQAPFYCCSLATRSSLPFPREKAKYYRELEAAVDVVERACRLCVDVKKTLLSGERPALEKNDSTPVTVADFGVQSLISLELGRLFPSIPLVAEEDSSFLRSSYASDCESDGVHVGSSLVDAVYNAVTSYTSSGAENVLTSDEVLEAIDRGGKTSVAFSNGKPATYWILDPIDGTRGFLRGDDALFVVGLALVVEGSIAVGVMGCPNWKHEPRSSGDTYENHLENESGIIMIAHKSCGTWTQKLSLDNVLNIGVNWLRCCVDNISLLNEAHFCIPDSQTWNMIPISTALSATTDAKSSRVGNSIFLLRVCCGSLCKYLMVASGRASVFILRAKEQTLIKAWDHAVGMICVHEAGGKVSDWEGRPLDLAADQMGRRIIYPSRGVLVTNGLLHRDILEIISSNVNSS